jgi:hypothetical protein
MHLAAEEKTEVTQASKGKRAVPRWKRAPTIMKTVGISLSADGVCDKLMRLSACGRFTAGYKIWPRSANCVLYDIGNEGSQYQAMILSAWPNIKKECILENTTLENIWTLLAVIHLIGRRKITRIQCTKYPPNKVSKNGDMALMNANLANSAPKD